jgi:hypothetical protein
MTIQQRFVWIDDRVERAEPFRSAFAGSLRNEDAKASLEIVQVNVGVLDALNTRSEQWKQEKPDLFLIDHDFSTAANRPFDLRGSVLAQLLRNQLPFVPMVCVTGQKLNSNKFTTEDLSAYTYLFNLAEITNEDEMEKLFAIAKDFQSICFPETKVSREEIIRVLAPPEVDKPVLQNVLPGEFESEYVHGASPHRIARWILNVLMEKPGFLSDSLDVATYLGLTERAFLEKVKPRFEAARYRGPFWTEAQPRWWTSLIGDVLYGALPETVSIPPREAGRKFEGIVEDDFSRCAYTGDHTPAPDVVAYTDSTKFERKAVRHRFTEPISADASSVLGFSTVLKIRKDR